MKYVRHEYEAGELMLVFNHNDQRIVFYFPTPELKDFTDGGRVQVRGTDVELSLNYNSGAAMWSGAHSSFDFLCDLDELYAIRVELVALFERLPLSKKRVYA